MATNSDDRTNFVEQAKLRTAKQRQREREQVDAAVAAELGLVLRGLPFADSTLRYATGELASLRDVLWWPNPARRASSPR